MSDTTTIDQYKRCLNLRGKARALGWDLEIENEFFDAMGFNLVPKRGLPKLLCNNSTVKAPSVELTLAFLQGWESFETGLGKQAGILPAEIGDRAEQQRVLEALQGKPKQRRKTPKTVL